MTTAALAFPDDDPHGVRHGYEAEGLDAVLGALELNGPIARRTVPTADLDLILSDAYLDYLLGVRATRPTAAERLAA